MRHCLGAWLVVAIGSSSAGCESFTPPPLAPHVDDTVPLPRGTAMLAVVYTEATSGRAIEVRPSWQASADVRVGVGLTLAFVPGHHGDHEWQFTGFRLRTIRGFAAWNPVGIRWGALSGGVGYGVASTGLEYVTFDGGLALGSATRPIAGGGALWGGASKPVRSGRTWFEHHPRPYRDYPRTEFPVFAWNPNASDPPPKHPAPDHTTWWLGVELFGAAAWGDQPQRAGLALGLLLGDDRDAGQIQAALGYGYGFR